MRKGTNKINEYEDFLSMVAKYNPIPQTSKLSGSDSFVMPKALREFLKLKEGDVIAYYPHNDTNSVIIKKVNK